MSPRSPFIFRVRAILGCLLAFALSWSCGANQKPNIILILADDLGWSDVGCYGGDLVETPNIDKLADNGVRFIDFYSASPVCSPTRASILTGKHPARLHLTTWIESTTQPTGNTKVLPAHALGNLPATEKSIAQFGKQNGYLTALVGKWHLGDEAHYPEVFGFDVNIGGTHWGAPESFFFPYRGSNTWGDGFRYVPHLELGKTNEYLTDRLTDEAVKFIERADKKPYFLYLAHHASHTPIEAKLELINHFAKNISTNPQLHHRNAKYAAMIKSLDDSVGRIVKELKKRREDKNTFIIFTSDNGGFIGKWENQQVTDNFPLRSGKGSLYEGGIRVPMIVCGPGLRKGVICNQPATSTDLFSTIAEVMSGQAPDSSDGVSILPALKSENAGLKRDTLFFHFPHYYSTTTPASAIRAGDWKLLEYYEDGRAELYNLHDDPSEKNNVAAQFPEKTEKLKAQLHEWLKNVDAQLPVVNPNFKPRK